MNNIGLGIELLTCLLFECSCDFTLSYGLAISVPLGLVSSSRFFHAVCLLAISVPLVSKPYRKAMLQFTAHRMNNFSYDTQTLTSDGSVNSGSFLKVSDIAMHAVEITAADIRTK